MVIVYIGIGVAILIAIILFKKILSSPPTNAFQFDMVCKKCGAKTGGLRCSKCASTSNKQSWR